MGYRYLLGGKGPQVQILSVRHCQFDDEKWSLTCGDCRLGTKDGETSILLATYPGHVRDRWETAVHSASDRRHLITVGMSGYTESGVIGYPSRASAEKGRDFSIISAGPRAI